MKTIHVCNKCGSPRVWIDAQLDMNYPDELSVWDHIRTLDSVSCEDCNDECSTHEEQVADDFDMAMGFCEGYAEPPGSNAHDLLYGALHALGYAPRSYSGRGMLGAQCLGFAAGGFPAMLAIQVRRQLEERTAATAQDLSTVLGILVHYRTDQLGKEFIYYFPQVPWTWDRKGEGHA